ncbi:MAG: hypothetical protein AAFR02_10100, partial [Pseudomonadota bacterium]
GDRVYPIGEGEVYRETLAAFEAQSEPSDDTVMDQAANEGFEGANTGEAREWLAAKAKGLDMSQEGRMARAAEQGFDTETVLYHGTDADFEAFDRNKIGKNFGYDKAGFFFTTRKDIARGYSGYTEKDLEELRGLITPAQAEDIHRAMRLTPAGKSILERKVLPVFASIKRPLTKKEIVSDPRYQGEGGIDAIDFYDSNRKLIEQLIDDGEYDGAIINHKGTDVYMVSDPSNIRSVHAAFDPDSTGSANLLAQSALPEGAEVLDGTNGLVAIRSDRMGFTTSAEKALFDPPPRFRDARNLTAVQWRKYFKEAGVTGEGFEVMVEPALATLPQTGDISKADVVKAVRAARPEVEVEAQKALEEEQLDDQFEGGVGLEADYSEYVSPGPSSNYRQELIILPEAAAGYRSHNWETEGVVGHIRTTDRQTVSGEAVRFVDELQSDLHQEGAQYGYSDGGVKTVTHQDIRAAEERTTMLIDRFVIWKSGLPDKHPDKSKPVWSNNFEDAAGRELAREANEAHRAANELRETGSNEQQPPRAPIKDWEKPLIRRVLQQAIADDKDVVAFTNHASLHDALKNEGTQKFYDQRMPAHIRKIAKELGAKVERAKIPNGQPDVGAERIVQLKENLASGD